MDLLRAKMRRELVRQDVMRKVLPFIDQENRSVDMKGFFKQNPYYRNKMTYYFGSMAEFYEELGVQPEYNYVKELKKKVQRKKTRSFRNELATERLDQLRQEGVTLEEIGQRYGVTKQAVQQLIILLDSESL